MKLSLSTINWKIAFFAYLATLVGIMLLADLGMLKTFILAHPPYDKLGHFMLYGIASFLSHRAINRRYLVIFGVSIPLGPFIFSHFTAFEEILQSILPNRSASFEDFFASMTGIILFYWIGEKLDKK
ncbi:MAG TPA: VanZ family protein [Halomicronema sp.]